MSSTERARGYVTSVLQRIPSFDSDVVSVIIFGSYVKEDLSESSDVDLLVIVKDSASKEKVIEVISMLKALEIDYGLVRLDESFVGGVLQALSMETGMFASHFVCRESSFVHLDFDGIFRTDRLVSALIAPKGIVLGAVLSHAKTVYGKDLLAQITPLNVSFLDVIRSLGMNLLLASGAVFMSLVDPDKAVRFSMQAIKWSLFSACYFLYGKSLSLTQLTNGFLRGSVIYPQIARMMELRNQPAADRKFILLAPVAATILHLLSLKMKKSGASLQPSFA